MTWVIHGAALLVVLLSIMNSNWALLRQSSLLQHLSLGGMAVLSVIWTFSAELEQGLSIHFLGVTALTLMLGFRRAVVVGAGIVLLNLWVSSYSLSSISALYLSHIVVPALVTYVAYAIVYHRLPRHPFVYIFVNAFITAAIAIAAAHMAHATWALSSGYLSWDNIWQNYLVITPLVMFPEALLNGMAVTLMVVYKPEWLKTFSDPVYIDGN